MLRRAPNAIMRLIERHLEKAALLASAALLAWSVWRFVPASPNQVVYRGTSVSAARLDRAILDGALELKQAAQQARAGDVEPVDFSRTLAERQRSGLGPPGAATAWRLPALAARGRPVIDVSLDERHSVALPVPPAPDRLAVGSGLSVLGAEQRAGVSWVTIGAWWDGEAQRAAALRCGAASVRARPIVATLELQRQERLPSGLYSAWRELPATAAPPARVVPPIVDASGGLSNKLEIDECFVALRANQAGITRPAFPFVCWGDVWEPILDGLDPASVPETPPTEGTSGPKTAPSPDPDPGLLDLTGPRGNSAGVVEQQARVEAHRQAQREFVRARDAYLRGDYQTALSQSAAAFRLEPVKSDRRRAAALWRQARRVLAQGPGPAPASGAVMPSSSVEVVTDGGSANAMVVPVVDRRQEGELAHPDAPRLTPVWAHDLSAAPGATYRYRLRVVLWNRYVGRPRALANAADAARPVVHGAWSAASAPITVAAPRRFYVVGPGVAAGTASIEVWAWHEGLWLRERFEAGVGEPIGALRTVKTGRLDDEGREIRASVDFSVGAVLLDVDRPQALAGPGLAAVHQGTAIEITYVDTVAGGVWQRNSAQDRGDAQRLRLISDEF